MKLYLTGNYSKVIHAVKLNLWTFLDIFYINHKNLSTDLIPGLTYLCTLWIFCNGKSQKDILNIIAVSLNTKGSNLFSLVSNYTAFSKTYNILSARYNVRKFILLFNIRWVHGISEVLFFCQIMHKYISNRRMIKPWLYEGHC